MKELHRVKARLVLALLGCFTAVAALAADNRPSILFCLADDWSWPHAGVYGDRVVRTPTFDLLAREGIRFDYCFSAAPSCTPSRAAMLTGQYPHRLEQGSCLWSFLPHKFPVYPDLLEKAGYAVGCTRKGWGPGDFQAGGFTHNPAGPEFKDFSSFLKTVPEGEPFCFWFGSHDPHRPYEAGSGAGIGLKTDHVVVPPYWPDNEVSRNDVLDYYFEVERFDREVNEMLDLLKQAGRLDNTMVVLSGDNGWPFPRCKANLYDGGTRQPLAVWWPGRVKAGQVSDDFINLMDLAPTFLEAAGLKPPAEMTGRSFLGLLTGQEKPGSRGTVFLERERHANVRVGDVGYPMRAIRTRDYLYIRNPRPARWPAGDPQAHKDPYRPFGDCDDGPTKNYILEHRDEPAMRGYFELCFGKRPAEELYDLKQDPHQLRNVAGQPEYLAAQEELRAQLDRWMRDSADPRATRDDDHWDAYPYFGGAPASKAPATSEMPKYLIFWSAPEKAGELAERVGIKGDGKTRLLGFGLPNPTFEIEAQLPARIRSAFAAAREHDLAVMLHFDFHLAWKNRPDLWNWFDPQKPGYDPKNKYNVEWHGWDGPPNKVRYLNHGVLERMAPNMCFTSKRMRAEVTRIVSRVIGPVLREEIAKLQAEGREALFAGVLVGLEPSIDDYSQPDPERAKMMQEDGVAAGPLGYRALLDRGFSADHPPDDFRQALANIIQETIAFWCEQFVDAGIPAKDLYPHVAAPAPIAAMNAPIWTAFNRYSRPGWTTYAVEVLGQGFKPLYDELEKHGNPAWAGVEANAGMPGSLVDWETYLAWHYNHGCVLVGVNMGATGEDLPRRLWDSAFSKEAMLAYHKFLAGQPLVEKPLSEVSPQVRIQTKMKRVRAGIERWQRSGKDPSAVGKIMEGAQPLANGGKLEELEKLVDQALAMLSETGPVPESNRRK